MARISIQSQAKGHTMRLRPRAFTLAELMIVVAILGVTAALALPRVSTMMRVRAAAQELTRLELLVQDARDQARAELSCVRVTNPSPDTLRRDHLRQALDGTCMATLLRRETLPLDARAIALSTPFSITFDRTGSLVGVEPEAVDITVSSLLDGSAAPRTLRVYRELGQARKVR
jgi:prepilin-type N-terminal cleavage/methylation domain-containing protein